MCWRCLPLLTGVSGCRTPPTGSWCRGSQSCVAMPVVQGTLLPLIYLSANLQLQFFLTYILQICRKKVKVAAIITESVPVPCPQSCYSGPVLTVLCAFTALGKILTTASQASTTCCGPCSPPSSSSPWTTGRTSTTW